MSNQQYDDIARLLLRLTLGILLLFHGIAKLSHGVAPIEGMLQGHGLPGFIAYGVYIGEVIAPLMVILGYYSRLGAGIIVINMLVAILLAHSHDLLTLTAHGGWRLELQGFYLVTALVLMLMGPGRLSLNTR
jgi:putative oxidoreductase